MLVNDNDVIMAELVEEGYIMISGVAPNGEPDYKVTERGIDYLENGLIN